MEIFDQIILHSLEEILKSYFERKMIDNSNDKALLEGISKWIIGNTSPSFYYEGRYVNVDYAVGAGSGLGRPTNSTHVTVVDGEKYKRYTVNRLVQLYTDTRKNVGVTPEIAEQLSFLI